MRIIGSFFSHARRKFLRMTQIPEKWFYRGGSACAESIEKEHPLLGLSSFHEGYAVTLQVATGVICQMNACNTENIPSCHAVQEIISAPCDNPPTARTEDNYRKNGEHHDGQDKR
jgi:hypothetical protein